MTTTDLPHWDMTVIYPGLDSPEFEDGFQTAVQNISNLTELFDRYQISRVENATISAETVTIFETIVQQLNSTMQHLITLNAYISALVVTDSRNEPGLARQSELSQQWPRVSVLQTRLTAWLGSLDVETLIAQSSVAREHAYFLRQAKERALHLMSPAEEALAADLNLTGSYGWYQLFGTYTSQLTATVTVDGEEKNLPLTAVQNMVYHPDRTVRQQSFAAVADSLQTASVPIAAALNAIKGESIKLAERRGWADPLDEVLFDNAIDRETLDAMLAATRGAYPAFRRYLKSRATYMGLPVMAYYDRVVALGQGSKSWSYDEAKQFILEQFGTYSEKMRHMAERAFTENWIDVPPRDGKRGGAFCMGLRPGESRILLNYEPSYNAVSTLAHELGHAYHNVNLAERTVLQRDIPMTLAETASTFCQKIVDHAALAKSDAQDQFLILDGSLEYASRVVLNANSDFLFEQRLLEKRRQRSLSPTELRELALGAQKEVFGDSLAEDGFYPYRWAIVPHYYGANYYNFPYIFGLLFGLGLYAQYQQDPAAFRTGYDNLLSRTGMENGADLAARFGMDIRQPAFWEASLDVLRADIDRFEQLVGEMRKD